jgi:hypothetical protein
MKKRERERKKEGARIDFFFSHQSKNRGLFFILRGKIKGDFNPEERNRG